MTRKLTRVQWDTLRHIERHGVLEQKRTGDVLVRQGLIEMSCCADAEGLYTTQLTAAGIAALEWARQQKVAGRSFARVRTQGRL
jgi:hypothetical protein